MGAKLKEFRAAKGLSLYKVALDGGIRLDTAKTIEHGSNNYSIDSFVGYISGCNLYMYFGEKDKAEEPHDFSDLAEKAFEHHPQ